jgi:hypothetical protein
MQVDYKVNGPFIWGLRMQLDYKGNERETHASMKSQKLFNEEVCKEVVFICALCALSSLLCPFCLPPFTTSWNTTVFNQQLRHSLTPVIVGQAHGLVIQSLRVCTSIFKQEFHHLFVPFFAAERSERLF